MFWSFLCENNGKGSIKRILAFLFSLLIIFVVLFRLFTAAEDFDWTSTVLLITALGGIITALIVTNAIEKNTVVKNLPTEIPPPQ